MSASPFAQRSAPIVAEAWRSAPAQTSSQAATASDATTPSTSSTAQSEANSHRQVNGTASGPSLQRVQSLASSSPQASSSRTGASTASAGPSAAPSEMGVAGTEKGSGGGGGGNTSHGATSSALSASERHASKARRMSSGGSRVPSEEPASAAHEGDDRRSEHRSSSSRVTASTPTSNSTLGDANAVVYSRAAQGRGSTDEGTPHPAGQSSELRPHLDLATFPPHDLLRVLATLLHQIATANDQLRPASATGTSGKVEAPDTDFGTSTGGSAGDRKKRHRDQNGPPEMAIAPSSDGSGAGAMGSFGGGSSVGGGIGGSSSSATSPSVEAAMGGFDADGNPRRRLRPTTAAMAALQAPTSTLCFHARNVPSISIEAYLMRILKYCPTTNEVFLSLLVYFDRMSRMGHRTAAATAGQHASTANTASTQRLASEGVAFGHSAADGQAESTSSSDFSSRPSAPSAQADHSGSSNAGSSHTVLADGMPPDGEPHVGIRGFAIDSYNVHRLVIAGITVASKFFSDVFYTNSRYAKVGGLPVHELNQLELQFLLLNDFSLMIPLEEMQHYADQLLYYASAPATSAADSVHDTALTSSNTPQASSTASAPAANDSGSTHANEQGSALHSRDYHGDTAMRTA